MPTSTDPEYIDDDANDDIDDDDEPQAPEAIELSRLLMQIGSKEAALAQLRKSLAQLRARDSAAVERGLTFLQQLAAAILEDLGATDVCRGYVSAELRRMTEP